ncbi:ketoacyl-ACP synthase III [Catenulispora sp. NF23]|uniref:beta-ketoacyl-ACP synthase III n=1 Tax=Catenulispora pinistramenti TaxID=2705254 RepID=UPI001BA72623|nr:beta-ketoacyl-ACP synthase III [Catenulispora pinistramenti]MBS2534585.1 ketoacyl-ACP synthase III [Catenulispora pinistramenti]
MTRSAHLAGIGSFLPSCRVPNAQLAARMDTSDEWIRTRTGIRQRYFAEPGTTTSDLAAEAGARAMKSAGLAEVGAVVLATTTPDRPCPATAPVVAAKLGLAGCPAFDVQAVCTGFVYALATACGLLAMGCVDTVLVIGAEMFSTILNPADRATSVIFGDGAGAMVLRSGHTAGNGAVGPFDLGSDGTGRDLITVRAGGAEQRRSGLTPAPGDEYFSMAGREVFRQAVEHMAQSARAVLGHVGWQAGDVDWLACHQANLRILVRLADVLGIPEARVLANIAEVGNTSAASIPLAIDQAYQAGRFKAGDRLLLSAFGGGLTWGSTVLTWPDLTHP